MHDRPRAIMWKHDVIHKTESTVTYPNAFRGGPSHGHRQQAQKIGEVRRYGFWIMRMDRQTDRHTHHNTHAGGQVTMLRTCTSNKYLVIYAYTIHSRFTDYTLYKKRSYHLSKSSYLTWTELNWVRSTSATCWSNIATRTILSTSRTLPILAPTLNKVSSFWQSSVAFNMLLWHVYWPRYHSR